MTVIGHVAERTCISASRPTTACTRRKVNLPGHVLGIIPASNTPYEPCRDDLPPLTDSSSSMTKVQSSGEGGKPAHVGLWSTPAGASSVPPTKASGWRTLC